METPTTIAQDIAATEIIAASWSVMVQNLESGPDGDEGAWVAELNRRRVQFNVLCDILEDLRAMKAQEEDLQREYALDHAIAGAMDWS